MLNAVGKLLIASGLPVPMASLSKFLEFGMLSKTLVSLGVNCVLDVGANQGQFADNLRKIGYRGYIVSFEPIQEEFAKLATRFHKDKRWSGYNLAIGNEDAVRPFNIAVESTVMSSFFNPVDHNWNIRREQVEIKTLDTLFDEILVDLPSPHRVFLKMDTQGYDLEVIKGAAKSIHTIVGLQLELSITPIYQAMPSYLEVLEYCEQLSFSLIGISDNTRTEKGCLVDLNCIMARIELLGRTVKM